MEYIHNDKYFIDTLNVTKAIKFTALYHYSGTAFNNALLNLGIFRIEDKKLVGVLQWGRSYQNNINLKRYVLEDIGKEKYLELNRFCMADEEGKNAESQGISLGIKWIKQKRPDIELLVSYSGRKEGNYGYIYQATNWKYLGYFMSNAFWSLDGEERHAVTVWRRHERSKNSRLSLVEDLCTMYKDVRQTVSKQFIYVLLMNKKLTLATKSYPYPKPAHEFPIVTKTIIYKENKEIYESYSPRREYVEYYHTPKEVLFPRRKKNLAIQFGLPENSILIEEQTKGKEIPIRTHYGQYDKYGKLEKISDTLIGLTVDTDFTTQGIRRSIKNKKFYKDKIFYIFDLFDIIPAEIEVPCYCIIDEIPFYNLADAQRYLGISKQAISQSKARKSTNIIGKDVIWC